MIPVPEAVKVFFGEAQSNKVLDCKNNRLVVEVPETAVTGNLSLQIYNKKVENIGYYTVLPTPRVITVTSDSEDGEGVADTGDRVTITGENFGADPSDISGSASTERRLNLNWWMNLLLLRQLLQIIRQVM